MRTSAIPGWVTPGVCLYLAALTLYRLDVFPALHGDEAWVGLFAQRLRVRGLFTPHEMNTYTGPLFGWIVSKLFSAYSVNVFYLRITGALLNLAGVFFLAFHFSKRLGGGVAAAWVYLLATSAMFLYTGRVAWEVCAFQGVLLAAIIWACRVFVEENRYSLGAVAIFLLANYAGVWNHFIFLSVPASLCVLGFYGFAVRRDLPGPRFFQLAVWNLLMCSSVFFFKPPMTDEFWQRHLAALLGATAGLPLVFSFGFAPAARYTERWVRNFFGFFKGSGAQKSLKRFFAAGLLAFFAFHAAPIAQIFSNIVLFQRVAGWTPPLWLEGVLTVFGAAIVGACFYGAYRGIFGRKLEFSPYERFLVYWPVVYVTTYTFFRHTSSIRYYIIPWFLFLVSASVLIPRLAFFRRRAVVAGGLAVALLLNVCYWSEIVSPGVRPPIRFRIGWRKEKSADFMSKRPIYDVMVREKVCRLVQDESMIDIPIFFRRNEAGWECDQAKNIAVSYCWDCDTPPYFTWRIGRSPP